MRVPVDLQALLGAKYIRKTLNIKSIDDKKRNYKKALSRLPANRKKLVKYRDKTISTAWHCQFRSIQNDNSFIRFTFVQYSYPSLLALGN
jgi:hypothetical protein